MQSLSDGITLVDLDGHPVAGHEKGLPPLNLDDAAQWLPSYEVDCVHYEVSDLAECAALEAAEIGRQADLSNHLTPDGEAPWVTLMVSGSLPAISGGAPEPFEPSEADWADYHGWSEDLDRRRQQVSDVELAMLAAGLPIG